MENASAVGSGSEVAGASAVTATVEVPRQKRKYTKRPKGAVEVSDLSATVEAIVKKTVDARLKAAKSAAIKAFTDALEQA